MVLTNLLGSSPLNRPWKYTGLSLIVKTTHQRLSTEAMGRKEERMAKEWEKRN
jgi:hypothetical protein